MGDGNALGVFTADIIVPYDCAAGLGVFDGIVQQIDKNLLHLARIDLRMAVCGGTVKVRYKRDVSCFCLWTNDGFYIFGSGRGCANAWFEFDFAV